MERPGSELKNVDTKASGSAFGEPRQFLDKYIVIDIWEGHWRLGQAGHLARAGGSGTVFGRFFGSRAGVFAWLKRRCPKRD